MSEIPDIFGAYFTVKENLVLSFDDVVFSKGVSLHDKYTK